MSSIIKQNLEIAKKFLCYLSPSEKSEFTFQIFYEKNDSSNTKAMIKHGNIESLFDEFVKMQSFGAGVFVTIQETDLSGRKKENIKKIRAVFVDLDGSPLDPILEAPLQPHLIIESSPSRYHAYWIVNGIKLEQFSLIQKKLIKLFKGDPQVHDLARVMRLPGFIHQKKDPFLTTIIQENKIPTFPLETFLNAFNITLSDEQDLSIQDNDNPFLSALSTYNILVQPKSQPKGCWMIRCPWEHLHSIKDKNTFYYEPGTNGYAHHGFKCFHSHCENKTIHDLAFYLDLTEGGVTSLL